MIAFLVDETHLARLSPAARRELLAIIGEEVARLTTDFGDDEWNPDGRESYPLTEAQAVMLIRGVGGPGVEVLRAIARGCDGEVGRADLDTLMRVSGFETYQDLGREINEITRLLRGATGHQNAWLFNWYAKDWEWDEDSQTYRRGAYFVSGPAVRALRRAFGIEKESGAQNF